MTEGALLTKEEVIGLLLARGGSQRELFAQAVRTRDETLGRALKIRGVVEISNRCVKNCGYCAMRRDNKDLARYRLESEAVLFAAEQIMEAGIKTVFLQSGQDPDCDALINRVLPEISGKGAETLLCVGEKDKRVYESFRKAGADSYILKFEASNKALYKSSANSDLGRRLECIQYIKETGMKLGTGNIIGLPGQTVDDIAEDILLAVRLAPDFVSCSPFVANKGTPFENMPAGDMDLILNAIAVWRIMIPRAMIPAVSALEYVRPSGQAAGLSAGANVVTVNFTPREKLGEYAIYAKDRFVVSLGHARGLAEAAGMEIA